MTYKILSLVKITVPLAVFAIAAKFCSESGLDNESSVVIGAIALLIYLGMYWRIAEILESGLGVGVVAYRIGQWLIARSGHAATSAPTELSAWQFADLLYNYSLRFSRREANVVFYQYKSMELLAVSNEGLHVCYRKAGRYVWSQATHDAAKIDRIVTSRIADIDYLAAQIERTNKPKNNNNNHNGNNGNNNYSQVKKQQKQRNNQGVRN